MKNIKSRYDFEIKNIDKVLFGKSGFTKGDLLNYYAAIAPTMMPYVKNRPISMQRFPNGIHHEGFFQKDAGDYFPDWITRFSVEHKKENIVDYVVIDKPETLLYLANQANIAPHIWLSRIDKPENPDRIIFDLDPAGKSTFADVQWAAEQLKKILDDLELPSFYMLTGSRGAHIIIPIKRLYTFDDTRDFAHDIALLLAKKFPKKLTTTMQKKERGNKIFIDWLRNGFGATGVAPYAVRALEGAPVAMPVPWKELCKKGMSSQKYTIKNAIQYVRKVGDAWEGLDKHAVSLTKAKKKLTSLA